MSEPALGALAAIMLVVLLLGGMPVAFALGGVSLLFLLIAEGPDGLHVAVETLFGVLDSFALVAIPMFVLMGAAIAASRAPADIREALERGLWRLPGGGPVAGIGACGIFAALTGSSRTTCTAIGRTGIPEMRQRGYPAALATGAIAAGGTLGILIPPSITMIVYGIATGTPVGRLFIAGLLPGLMLMGLFMVWAWLHGRREASHAAPHAPGWSLGQALAPLLRIGPFLLLTALVLWAVYTGVATPSEAAAASALLALVLAIVFHGSGRPRGLWRILRAATGESAAVMVIIATAGLFSYTMSSLHLWQGIVEWTVSLDPGKWWLLLCINALLLGAGLLLPAAAVILIAAPALVPLMDAAGFDPLWFGVMLVLNMQIASVIPPLGVNLRVVEGIATDVRPSMILRGALPFAVCMAIAIVLLGLFPGIALWLPDRLMGDTL